MTRYDYKYQRQKQARVLRPQRMNRVTRPALFNLFLGLLVGYVAMIGISSVVDAVWFPGEGHWVHGW